MEALYVSSERRVLRRLVELARVYNRANTSGGLPLPRRSSPGGQAPLAAP